MSRFLLALACVGLAADAAAASQTASPSTITGIPSGARHCVSADGANVHGLGWIEINTGYSVSFDSGTAATSAFARFDLAENRVAYAFGTPDFNGTAGLSGTMALIVAGNGQPACYRYKTEVRSTAAQVAEARATGREVVAVPRSIEAATGRAITGSPSSGTYCVSGTAAHTHGLGRVAAGRTLAVTFSADFNAAAGIIVIDPATQQRTAYRSLSSGGTEPSLTTTPTHAGEAVLFVGSLGNAAGCYRFKVELR